MSGFSFGGPPATGSSGFSFNAPAASTASNPAAPAFSFSTPSANAPAATPFSFGGLGSTTAVPPPQATVPQPQAAAPPAFGTPQQPSSTFSFGGAAPNTTVTAVPLAQNKGFSFGGGASITAPNPQPPTGIVPPAAQALPGLTAAPNQFATQQPQTGFGFGSTTTPTASVAPPPASTGIKLNFGGTPSSSTGGGMNFGGTPSSSTGAGLSFGAASTTATAQPISTAPPAFGFGVPTATVAATTTAPASTNPTTGFSFGTGAAQSPAPSTTVPPTAATGIISSSVPPTTIPTIGVPTSVPTIGVATPIPASSANMFGGTKATAAPPPLTTGVQSTSGIAPPVSLSTATTTTASSAASVPGATMSYRQLEESINKWTIELEEQEKIFLNQATQVNSWDRMIFENGEAIVNLNEDVEKVKADQTRLEHELDFIKGLQSELEDVLKPLESSVAASSSTATGSLNNSGMNVTAGIDTERERVYQKAEQMDAQLQRMSEDLKEIIVHINAQNRAQDDSNDPIVQIGKVLNAHMDSLQWVDQSMVQVQKKLDEVTKLQELRKKETERIGLF